MRKLIIIAVVGALAVAAFGCSSGDDEDSGEAAEVAAEAGGDGAVQDAVAVSQPSRGGGSLPSVGPSIVQTASLAVSVPRNEFETTIQRARTIATGAGGFVVSSSASQGDEQRLVRGSLVVRVPEPQYARVLEQLSGLGTVEAQEEAGQDVSQELVDLEARIRHLEAVEARLLGFLEQANTVAAALTVQSELNRVQLELEQARGRLDYLDDQVAFATISLDVRERQVAAAEGDGGGPWGIVDAWRAAGTGFVTVVGWIFVAVATIAIAVVALAAGLFANGLGTRSVLLLLGLGVIALFIGVALLASRLVQPLAALVGWPAGRMAGSAGQLARENAVRNPGRTASTAAALMIGLALVTVVAVLGASLRDSAQSAVEKQIDTDYVVTHENGFDPFPAAAGDAVAAMPEVEESTNVRFDQALAADSELEVTGLEPTTIGNFYDFAWEPGSEGALERLGGDGAIVQKNFADDHDLALGSRFTIETSNGATLGAVVRGIYDPPELDQLLGAVSVSQRNFDSSFPRPRNQFTFVNVSGGETAAATEALETTVAAFPDVKLHTESDFVTSRTAEFSTLLNLLYVLLAFSVVVSLFGMVNTLVLSVFERTRELGMLRAVGMTRRQARQMIRHESVITALIGAALGLPLGIFLAALVAQALSQFGVGFSLPIGTLAVFLVVAIVAGVLAAVLPARRASRLNVLEALQYE